MYTMIRFALVFVLTLAPASTMASILFADNFDTDTSASWNVNASSPDSQATFAFDYSGITTSPGGGGSTSGLKLEANMLGGPVPFSTEAITLSPIGRNFSGSYQLAFDLWINFGGVGTTEYVTAGIGYDDATVNKAKASASDSLTGSGGWFAVNGDGGSRRDYRAFKNASEQFSESRQFAADPFGTGNSGSPFSNNPHNASNSYYNALGGATGAGMAWRQVTIDVDGNTALWAIDGIPIVDLDPSRGISFPLTGNISIGYMDTFSSVSDPLAFALIDNLVVSSVPEPATLALLGAGLAGLGFSRRRKRYS